MGNLPITIIDVFDEYALTNVVREEMYKCYPNAKLAHLKNGGNFPYLSRSADVNLYLQVNIIYYFMQINKLILSYALIIFIVLDSPKTI